MVAQILYGLILGVVRGITEFLPVSSKGHLLLLQEPVERWVGLDAVDPEPRRLAFDAVLHLGTLLALLIVLRRELLQLRWPQWGVLAVGTIPVAVAAMLFQDQAEGMFGRPPLAGIGLLVTAAFLFIAQGFDGGRLPLEAVSLPRAAGIGLFQAFSLFPGISRPGSTIAAGCLFGLERNAAARFAFLLAIPVMAGAGLVAFAKFLRAPQGDTSISVVALLVATGVSFVVGFFALQWLLRTIAKGRLYWFALYCLVFGLITIIWQTAVWHDALAGPPR